MVGRLISAELLEPLPQLVARPAPVATLEVQEAGGKLDQALVEVPILVGRGPPERLPRLVRVPVANAVEEGDRLAEEPLVLLGIEGGRSPAL